MINDIVRIIGSDQTPFLVFTNIIMWLLLFVLYKPAIKYPYQTAFASRYIGLIIIVLFCVFSFWGRDWFHALLSFELIRHGDILHHEEIYVWLMTIMPNYLVYRLVVWGSAFFLYYLTIKRLELKVDLTLFLFVSIWLIYFSYARASLAMAIIFFGLSIWAVPIKNYKILSKIIAVVIVLSASYFHKSAIFGIGVFFVLLASKVIKNKKLFFVLVVISLPLMLYFINSNLADFMSMDTSMEDGGLDASFYSSQKYLNMESSERGLGNIINKLFERIPYYVIAYLSYKELKKNTCSQYMDYFLRILMLLVVFSTVFAFDIGANTGVIYTRFLRFCAIPSSLCLSYILQENQGSTFPKKVMWFSIIGCIYHLVYAYHISH